mmetsp:Transcript_56226/g.98668  ORF Transcript_56226/g.98668 Transcript_56226/m.98668 type:complete len:265 (+) Transcript_56226:1676-2470(+)
MHLRGDHLVTCELRHDALQLQLGHRHRVGHRRGHRGSRGKEHIRWGDRGVGAGVRRSGAVASGIVGRLFSDVLHHLVQLRGTVRCEDLQGVEELRHVAVSRVGINGRLSKGIALLVAHKQCIGGFALEDALLHHHLQGVLEQVALGCSHRSHSFLLAVQGRLTGTGRGSLHRSRQRSVRERRRRRGLHRRDGLGGSGQRVLRILHFVVFVIGAAGQAFVVIVLVQRQVLHDTLQRVQHVRHVVLHSVHLPGCADEVVVGVEQIT